MLATYPHRTAQSTATSLALSSREVGSENGRSRNTDIQIPAWQFSAARNGPHVATRSRNGCLETYHSKPKLRSRRGATVAPSEQHRLAICRRYVLVLWLLVAVKVPRKAVSPYTCQPNLGQAHSTLGSTFTGAAKLTTAVRAAQSLGRKPSRESRTGAAGGIHLELVATRSVARRQGCDGKVATAVVLVAQWAKTRDRGKTSEPACGDQRR